MTPEESLIFDHQGYLILRNVLSTEEVLELNALADERMPWQPETDSKRIRQAFFFCQWGLIFQRLIDHPKILPYLVELVGRKFRLDHDYTMFMDQGCPGNYLHGLVPYEWEDKYDFEDFWYRKRPDGSIYAGLTVVTWCLSDAVSGDGGFGLIPGSHRDRTLAHLPDDVIHLRRIPDCIVQPTLKAGDVVIFTETLMHCTLPWHAKHERRVLLLKYLPGHLSWMGNFYDTSKFESLTPQQMRILQPPHIELLQSDGKSRRDRPQTMMT